MISFSPSFRIALWKQPFLFVRLGILLVSTSALASAFLAARAQTTDPAVFEIYTAHIPPYVAPIDGFSLTSNKVTGSLTLIVTEYFSSRGLQYNLVMLPWSATYKRVQASPNGLIFPLDRTEEREDLFHWIVPLHTNEYYVYGLKGKAPQGLSLQKVAQDGAQVSCTKHSVQCTLLAQGGLPEENILRVEGSKIPDCFQMIMRGRNLYSVFDPLVFETLAKERQSDSNKLVRLFKVGERTSYLAANKNISEAGRNQLRQ